MESTIENIDKYVSTWNPRRTKSRNKKFYQEIIEDPFLLETNKIMKNNPLNDYIELLNHVQRHTKCTPQTCLQRKQTTMVCRYKAPWALQEKSNSSFAENGEPKYNQRTLKVEIKQSTDHQ